MTMSKYQAVHELVAGASIEPYNVGIAIEREGRETCLRVVAGVAVQRQLTEFLLAALRIASGDTSELLEWLPSEVAKDFIDLADNATNIIGNLCDSGDSGPDEFDATDYEDEDREVEPDGTLTIGGYVIDSDGDAWYRDAWDLHRSSIAVRRRLGMEPPDLELNADGEG